MNVSDPDPTFLAVWRKVVSDFKQAYNGRRRCHPDRWLNDFKLNDDEIIRTFPQLFQACFHKPSYPESKDQQFYKERGEQTRAMFIERVKKYILDVKKEIKRMWT